MRSLPVCSHVSGRAPALLALAVAVLAALPAEAKVVAEGKPSKGYYWQKVEQSSGKVQYMCRASASPGKLQQAASCEKAKAVKP